MQKQSLWGKKMNLDTYLHTKKIHFNWVIDSNVNSRAINILEDIGGCLCDLRGGTDFWGTTQKAQILH